ncbi:hypothetical protein JW911_01300 [Candidatus Peregrinibacteria bacterium]|nr:hypothetical protein [Candidatus Peregrinibacteria bacterium]
MVEKSSNKNVIDNFKPGMRVLKKPIPGMKPEYFEILDINRNYVTLRNADCGGTIQLDSEYFFENFICVDTIAPEGSIKPSYPEIVFQADDIPTGCIKIRVIKTITSLSN